MSAPYTVVLMIPDYRAHQYGEDHFCGHVYADSVSQAVERGQSGARHAYGGDTDPDDIDDLCDYAVLFLAEGHHDDIKPAE